LTIISKVQAFIKAVSNNIILAIIDISYPMMFIATPDTTLPYIATVVIHGTSERICIRKMETYI